MRKYGLIFLSAFFLFGCDKKNGDRQEQAVQKMREAAIAPYTEPIPTVKLGGGLSNGIRKSGEKND